MPYKDILGVSCMSPFEYWELEAEFEGKGRSGPELMSEFLDDVHQDVSDFQQHQLNHFRANPKEFLELCREGLMLADECELSCPIIDLDEREYWYRARKRVLEDGINPWCSHLFLEPLNDYPNVNDWAEYAVPVLIISIDIEDATFGLSEGTSVTYTGRAIADDGIGRQYRLSVREYPGDYYTPPDREIWFTWVRE